MATYYERNRERLLEYARRYREQNRELLREKGRKVIASPPLTKIGAPDLRFTGRRWGVTRQDRKAYMHAYERLPERRAARRATYAKRGPRPRPGWTRELRQQRLKTQRNRCAICRQVFTAAPCQDHDARTRTARGLLCVNCNHLIGKAGDSPAVLRRAADYLEKYA